MYEVLNHGLCCREGVGIVLISIVSKQQTWRLFMYAWILPALSYNLSYPTALPLFAGHSSCVCVCFQCVPECTVLSSLSALLLLAFS